MVPNHGFSGLGQATAQGDDAAPRPPFLLALVPAEYERQRQSAVLVSGQGLEVPRLGLGYRCGLVAPQMLVGNSMFTSSVS